MSQAFAAVKAGEESLLCRSYSRYPLAIVRGKGSRLWDVDGKEYVDLLAGIAVTALGHCNDEICAALEAQAHKLWHVSNLFYQEEQLELANYHKTTNRYRFYRRPSLLKSGPDQVTAIEVVLRLPDALGIFVLLLRL